MNSLVIIGLVIAGAIHLLPLAGLTGIASVERLYDVKLEGSDLGVLLLHRPVLFGLLGGYLIYAAFEHDARWPAIIAGTISAASFVVIAYRVGGFNAALKRVVIGDYIALAGLLLAAVGQSQL